MRTRIASIGLIAVSLVAGGCSCSSDDTPPEEGPCDGGACADEDADTPTASRILWEVSAEDLAELPDGACFGRSVALGDLDGDGDDDLVVGAPRCLGDGGSLPDALVVFAGEGELFAAEPIVVLLDWGVEVEFSFGQMTVDIAHADDDEFADLVVATRSGASFFRGGADIAAALAEPAVRLPGLQHRNWEIVDVNADGLGDLVGQRGIAAGMLLAVGDGMFEEAELPPMARWIRRAGDIDGDGTSELWASIGEVTELHPGCAAAPCGEPLTTEPLLSLDGNPVASGRAGDSPIVFAFREGMVEAHRLAPVGEGFSAELLWQSSGDPLFPGFGRNAAVLGDLEGGGSSLAVTAIGRVYLLSGIPVGDVAPVWAFPAADATGSDFPGYRPYVAVNAGDRDSDGATDVVVGGQQGGSDLTGTLTASEPGVVMLVSGAAVEGEVAPATIPALPMCGAPTDGPADLTLDDDLLRRSLSITRASFATDSCAVNEGCVGGSGERRLLRFSTSIRNTGVGPALVPSPETSPELFEFDECHGHDHLIDFATYELTDDTGTVASGRKQGFFLVDLQRYCADAGPQTFPTFEDDQTQLGISAGWADIYTADLDCQWIDITGLPDGVYDLRVSVNQEGVVPEESSDPNIAEISLEITGDSFELR